MTSVPNNKNGRPFWLSALILLAAASAAGYLLSLLTGISLSNLYFLAGTLFLLIAVFPVFAEVGGNARTSIKARQEKKEVREAIQEQQKSGRYAKGTRITFLYGICGFICFILALVTT
jgi:hypothetical protein